MGNALELIADFRDKKTKDELFYNRHHLKWGPIYKFNLSKLLSVNTPINVYNNADSCLCFLFILSGSDECLCGCA